MSWIIGIVPLLTMSVALQAVFALTNEEVLTTYGPLGIMSSALLWFAKGTVDRLVLDRNRALEQRDQMVNDMLNEFMPLLRRAIAVLEQRQEIDVEILAALRNSQRREKD